MKKIFFIVIVALVLTRTALSNEYREFTNKDGKSIHARIVQYDAEGERVELELPNRNKAWVQLSDLSEEDQGYIQQYKQEKASAAAEEVKDKPEPVKVLSEKELRAIGEQYIQAWNSGDIERVKVFFLQPENVTQTKFDQHKKLFPELKIYSVADGYLLLNAELNEKYRSDSWSRERTWKQWLLFTAAGKIKYDSSLQRHPIHITLNSMPVLYSRGDKCEKFRDAYYISNINSERAYEVLKDLGVPMFGLDLSRARYQIDKSLIKMTEWLMDEGDKWDSTEPKVFFPAEVLNKYKESGKYYH